MLDTKEHVSHGIEARKWVFQARPTQKMGIFCPKKGLKMPKLGLQHCFWGLGGLFEPPPPYFAGARIKKTSFAWYVSRKIGFFRAAPPKRWPFFGQKWPKIANLGKKAVFLDTGAQFKTPLPYFLGA